MKAKPLSPRATALHAAIEEVAAYERGEIELSTVVVPRKSITEWRTAAEAAAERITALEADRKMLREALEQMLEYSGIIEERCDCIATNAARTALRSTHD